MKRNKVSSDNLKKAFDRLESFLKKPVTDDRDEAGVIQAFEFTFELVWKTLKKVGESQGLTIASPRKAFEFGFQAGYLEASDEDSWFQMLEDRNNSTHAYEAEVAHQIFQRIRDKHVSLIKGLIERLE
jgi:nucleotidyltransferase substrate binding protein (TIGR01987 family)